MTSRLRATHSYILCTHCGVSLLIPSWRKHRISNWDYSNNQWYSTECSITLPLRPAVSPDEQEKADKLRWRAEVAHRAATLQQLVDKETVDMKANELSAIELNDDRGFWVDEDDEDDYNWRDDRINLNFKLLEEAEDALIELAVDVEEEDPPERVEEGGGLRLYASTVFLLMFNLWCAQNNITQSAADTLFTILALIFPSVKALLFAAVKVNARIDRELGLANLVDTKVACPSCYKLYPYSDCWTSELVANTNRRKKTAATCGNILYPSLAEGVNNRVCGAVLLLNTISSVTGKGILKPASVVPSVDIGLQIESFIARPNFTSYQTSMSSERQTPDNVMFDVMDGEKWKDPQWTEFRAESKMNMLVQLNMDWFQPYTYSPYSVCCVYLCILSLHRSVRYKRENVILLTLLPPTLKSKTQEPVKTTQINEMLLPATMQLLALWTDGMRVTYMVGELAVHAVCRVALFLVSCDMPATRTLGGFLAPSSRFGCWLCKKSTPQRPPPNTAAVVRDWGGVGVEESRSDEDQRAAGREHKACLTKADRERHARQYSGRFSVLHLLPYFDCIWSYVVDPMHCIFLGVVKKTLQLWIDTPRIPEDRTPGGSETEKILNNKALSARMLQVQLPTDVGRIFKKWHNPKGLGRLTAADMKNFLLLLSVTLLDGLIPKRHMVMWKHLVEGARALVSSHIVLIDELGATQGHLTTFCQLFEEAHGRDKMTPNMHVMLHLVAFVVLYGPCHVFWCFAFERYNKILTEVRNNRTSIEISIMKAFTRHQQLYEYACTSPCELEPDQVAHIHKLGGASYQYLDPDYNHSLATVDIWQAYLRRKHDLIGDEWVPVTLHLIEGKDPTLIPPAVQKVLQTRLNNVTARYYGDNFGWVDSVLVGDYRFCARRMTYFGETITVNQRSAHVLVFDEKSRWGYWCGEVLEIFTFDLTLISDLSEKIDTAKRRKLNAEDNENSVEVILEENNIARLRAAQSVTKTLTFAHVRYFLEADVVPTVDGTPVQLYHCDRFKPADTSSYIPVGMITERFSPYKFPDTVGTKLFKACVLPLRVNG
jgi:hypothetical protein